MNTVDAGCSWHDEPTRLICPDDGTKLVPRMRYSKDTGLLICPRCWHNFDKKGNPAKNPFCNKGKYAGLKHPR
jgi:hypothetical protein